MKCIAFILLFCRISSALRSAKAPRTMPIVTSNRMIAETSYSLEYASIGLSALSFTISSQTKGVASKFGAIIAGLIFSFLASYITNVSTLKYSFDDTAFAIVNSDGTPIHLHPLFGTPYVYPYSTINDFTFLPSAHFPVFLYIAEIATPIEKIIPSPILVDGSSGSDPARQVHLFPVIAECRQITEQLNNHHVHEILSPVIHIQPDVAKFVEGLKLL